MSTKVVSLEAVREIKTVEEESLSYRAQIQVMEKVQLLEEMMRFQEQRSNSDELTVEMMVRGQILFKALEENAESDELKLLTRSYRRHLKYELESYYKNNNRIQKSPSKVTKAK